MKLPKAKEMQALDQCAIQDFGIPGVVLMENAGVGTVRMMEETLGSCAGTFACIFVGPGNNGGDGLVIGRHLHQHGCQPIFFFLVKPDQLRGDAAINLEIIQKLRLPFHVIDTHARVETIPVLYKQFESRGLPCYALIDALFGTGLTRPITDHFAAIIKLINRRDFAHGVPVISADCPSGMDADSGKVLGTCVKADQTATYGCAKPGHYIHDSVELTGNLRIVDIGIPPEAIEKTGITTELVTRDVFRKIARQLTRQTSSHKGSHGHLLVLAGSPGKTGAAILSTSGALRGGCGLVSLCAPSALNVIYEASLVEAMTIPLPNSSTILSIDDVDTISESIDAKTAVVVGPGIGTAPETAKLIISLYENVTLPLVVDADALNILAAHKGSLSPPAGPRILTPHPGELSRLIGCSVKDIQDNRLEAIRTACSIFNNSKAQHVIILKGAGTIIATTEGATLINTTGNPGMATGGMGDVLTGLIGALLCQGISLTQAAAAAVFLHGAAADSLYENIGNGYTATEVAEAIPSTLKSLLL